jgi:hypothetical protein
MTTSGKQMTIVWHVDDLMGSCEDDFELTKLSCYLARIGDGDGEGAMGSSVTGYDDDDDGDGR